MNVYASNTQIIENKNIMQYQLYTNASKKTMILLKDLIGIKLIF